MGRKRIISPDGRLGWLEWGIDDNIQDGTVLPGGFVIVKYDEENHVECTYAENVPSEEETRAQIEEALELLINQWRVIPNAAWNWNYKPFFIACS